MTTSAQQQRLDEVRRLVRGQQERFRRQGAVVASWRTAGGRRHGPYWSLRYRDEEGRQRSRYLGRSQEAADEVRAELALLQQPTRQARALVEARVAVRASLRAHLRDLDAELRKQGMYLHGWKIRGWRHSRIRAVLYQHVYGITLNPRNTESPPLKKPKPPRLPGLPKPPRLPRLPGIGGPFSREIERLLLWELEPEQRRWFRPLADQVRLRKPALRRTTLRPPRPSKGQEIAEQRPDRNHRPSGAAAPPSAKSPRPQPEKPKNCDSVDQRRDGRGARGEGRVHRERPPPA